MCFCLCSRQMEPQAQRTVEYTAICRRVHMLHRRLTATIINKSGIQLHFSLQSADTPNYQLDP